ncbi:M10 family metallopeptidase [Ramlibacter sp.]|uniref:M10 family metallopeptidase n=1 Tax=Ramlibacter sp. TaxID=1917967 RepID=UPI002CA53DE9|nr:M10 family metallopeptidase [Ramlibacter sp.]HWI82112.1 M10 family metallopeptidase [Ramlibacter sp.]
MIDANGSGAQEGAAPGAAPAGGGDAMPLPWAGAFGDGYGFVGAAPPPSAASVAALLTGTRWTGIAPDSGRTTVTYSFDTADSQFTYSGADWSSSFQGTLQPFSAADRELTRQVLDSIEAVANVRFVEVPDDGQQVGVVRYGYSALVSSMEYAGYAFFPSPDPSAGDVWIGASYAAAAWDFFRPNVLLHETLHALGLADTAGSGLTVQENIIPNTVMSYSPVAGAPRGYMAAYPREPMPLDVAALQWLYGAPATNAGDTRYDLAQAGYRTNFRTIWDSAGTDVLDASGVRTSVSLDLNDGARSKVGVSIGVQGNFGGTNVQNSAYTATLAIAAGALIEDAIGSPYADLIVGNAAPNRLTGGAGNDTLRGGAGDDVLAGQAGSDQLDGGLGEDVAVYDGLRAGYTITRAGDGYAVRDQQGAVDTLLGIERVAFADAWVALDLDDHAGEAARLVGAVLGPAAVRQRPYVAVGISLLDDGMSVAQVAQYALDYRLGPQASHQAVAQLLYANLHGGAVDATAIGQYVSWLEQGLYSQAGLVQLAAHSPQNGANIDLVGLAAGGLDYAA